MKLFKQSLLLLSFTFITSFITISCNDDDDSKKELIEENINEKEIINALKNSLPTLQKLNKNKENKNQISLLTVKEKYINNLKFLSEQTGLNLEYNESEFNNMLSIVDGDLNGEFSINEKKHEIFYNNVVNSGNGYIINETKNILNEVYQDQNIQQKGITYSCGLALAGNFVSTLGLTACATGVGCPLAIAAKVLAIASVADSCL